MSAEVKTPLIKRSHVRKFTLDAAKSRTHKFTRVGGEFYIKCEANLRQFIRNQVHSLPCVGKTIL